MPSNGCIVTMSLRWRELRFLDRQKRKPCKPCHLIKPNSKPLPALADMEREVVAESREWGRQRLEERLQKLAEEHVEVLPSKATPKQNPHAAKRVRRHTLFGYDELTSARHGESKKDCASRLAQSTGSGCAPGVISIPECLVEHYHPRRDRAQVEV